MLGVVETPNDDPADQLLKELGEQLGVGDTYRKTPVGIFFGEQPGETVPDPFFGGEGPDRTGCMQCGRCMVGCPHGAKNTLVKNYLWLAERRGVDGDARPHGRRHPTARRARTAPTATRSRASPPACGATATAARSPPAASSSRPARSARTGCCSAAA